MVDALDRVGRDAQAHVALQGFRDERHVDEVRQEAALGLDVGVADLVADEGALGRQFAAARHVTDPLVRALNELRPPSGAPRGQILLSLQGAGGRIGGKGRVVKATGRFGPSSRGGREPEPGISGRIFSCHRPA